MARRMRYERPVVDPDAPRSREEYRVVRDADLDAADDVVLLESRRKVWSPAQPISLIYGVGMLVLGAMALARAGLGAWFDHVSVVNLHHTQVLAAVHLGVGVLFLLGAVSVYGARSILGILGAAILASGIIVVMDLPSAIDRPELHAWLGAHSMHGWMYIAMGAVGVLIAVIPSTFGRSRSTTVRREWR